MWLLLGADVSKANLKSNGHLYTNQKPIVSTKTNLIDLMTLMVEGLGSRLNRLVNI